MKSSSTATPSLIGKNAPDDSGKNSILSSLETSAGRGSSKRRAVAWGKLASGIVGCAVCISVAAYFFATRDKSQVQKMDIALAAPTMSMESHRPASTEAIPAQPQPPEQKDSAPPHARPQTVEAEPSNVDTAVITHDTIEKKEELHGDRPTGVSAREPHAKPNDSVGNPVAAAVKRKSKEKLDLAPKLAQGSPPPEKQQKQAKRKDADEELLAALLLRVAPTDR